MQDFVGICVADAAEQMRIGKRALERVVSRSERGGEFVKRRGEDIEAARIHRFEIAGMD